MRILETRVYVGPGPYAYFPVVRLTVDLGELEAWPTGRLGPAFTDRLLELLPGLREHGCSYGVPGGFVRRLTEEKGTWLGHVLEHAAIELQNAAGQDVAFGKARGTGRAGEYHVIFQYRDRDTGVRAGELARDIVASLLPDPLRADAGSTAGFCPRDAITAFVSDVQARALGPSTAALVRAAEQRRIPWTRLDDDHLLRFGYGSRQRRVHATITSQTGEIAVDVASDKTLTNRLLRGIGVPVPRQELVQSEAGAAAAALRIGLPVVVKPRNGNHGRGVTTGVRTRAELAAACQNALEHGTDVIVEEHLPGDDYRLLVVGDRVVAAARRVAGHVVGDGERSVAELVEAVNADPRRGSGHDNLLTRLELDAVALRMLAVNGLTPASVVPRGETVPLRMTANLSTGGTAIDVTDQVHPDNLATSVRAARAIGLDVAGIDFITPDISRPWLEVGGGVCEVNAAPGLRMHIAPVEGLPRDVAGAIIDFLFPTPGAATIPIAAITGTNGKTTTARMAAHIAAPHLGRIGLATSDGVYIDGRVTALGDLTGPESAGMVLSDATVDAAVLESARGGLLRAGLAFRRCSVGAVLNVTRDHIGLGGIESVAELAEVKRIVVEVARDVAVLNADDEHCLAMIEHTRARRTCLVSMRADNRAVAAHIAAGGLAVVLDGSESIVLIDGSTRTTVLPARDIPATCGGLARFNTNNALFATAIGYGLGVPLELVARQLRSFDTGFERVPGRFNIWDAHPFRVILDYGHNPAAVQAMGEAAAALAPDARRICVLGAPGDRSDDDIRAVGRAAAPYFHHFVCRHDAPRRGRQPHEVPLLLQQGLECSGVAPRHIERVPDEMPAIAAALRAACPGDLVVVFGDALEEAWRTITRFRPETAAFRAVEVNRERGAPRPGKAPTVPHLSALGAAAR
jgi:cyanophycin synthetase